MNAHVRVCTALALALAAGPALAQPAPLQPPMNDFDQAFYRCDGGEAFMMTYDSDKPASAEMVTNSDNRHYQLKRSDSKAGVEFSGGGAKFWTDGKSATAESSKGSFKNCKTKAS
jgi:membrane-bound inhibitor of C-type lysozyme